MNNFTEPVDERVRKTVFPVRIVQTMGNVESPENLLIPKPLQISTSERCVTLLRNGEEENAAVVLDFGREMNGSVRLLAFGSKLNRVHITCGESVSEALSSIGEKNATNDHAVRDFEAQIPMYSDSIYPETGFRFVCVRLLGKNCTLALKTVAAVAIYRDIPYLGSFRCDNETLNRIYDTAAYTCHLCMQNYIWDGIKRDRLVWQGDMHPEMLTVRTVFGRQKILEDSIRFSRAITPLPDWINGMPSYSLWWLIILWDWYWYTGDRSFLLEMQDYAVPLAYQIASYIAEDGSDTYPGYFLDWPARQDEELSRVGTRALMVLAMSAAAKLAEEYGLPEEKKLFESKREALLASPAEISAGKQVTAMLSLAGWLDEKQAAESILKDGARGWSTFMSYYLLKAASKAGMGETLSVLENYYGAMLDLGATTFWEDFNIDWLENAAPIDRPVPEGRSDVHGDNGAFCYKGLRHSLCHGWSSGPTAFLAEEVLGIRIEAPGCTRMSVAPDLGSLRWACGSYPTPLGILKVECTRREDGTVEVSYEAPEGMEVLLPLED